MQQEDNFLIDMAPHGEKGVKKIIKKVCISANTEIRGPGTLTLCLNLRPSTHDLFETL